MRACGLLVAAALGITACVPIGEAKRDSKVGGDTEEFAAVPGDLALNPHNLIANATFADGSSLPWTSSFTEPAKGEVSVIDGALCVRIDNRGQNAWDAQVRHREMVIQAGHRYHISFRAYASQPTHVRPKVGMQGPPFAEYWFQDLAIDSTPRKFSGNFRKSGQDDPTAELTVHMGGRLAESTHSPITVCIDDIRVEDATFNRPPKEKSHVASAVLVNQVGYYTNLAKIATVRSDSKQQIDWKLFAGDGHEVAFGKTQPVGLDVPSGDPVHVIDFSGFKGTGRGFVLAVGNSRSAPFEIGSAIYRKLKYDALAYFYHNRSGIEIAMPYAGGAQWTRPAGHLSDSKVPCAPLSGCTYTLDVSGGWYDAGDHGKYVVNGGISAWTLLNLYERSLHLGKSTAAIGDGTMSIPERKNGVSDLLDEARWEVELLLKMQVPDGEPKAGMVHHKIHDKSWTALGLAPHEDQIERYLYPPSTAATLNLAAVAAQAARIWRTIDPKFAKRCVEAAEKAWAAAVKNPAVLAAPGGEGGGPYSDKRVDDEFYWAAAELFITSKRPEYRQFLTSSPLYLKLPSRLKDGEGGGIPTSMTWQEVAALGTISLAVVPGALAAADQKTARQAIIAVADEYLAILKKRPFRVPVDWGEDNKAPWGSNSFLLDNLIVLGLAGDFSESRKYVNAAVAGMDYLLGRNAMDQCYVTGWGTRPLLNPHHRFWANQSNQKYPHAPPGAVSGGPNSGLQDPYVKAANLIGCAPEKCFADHIESYSTNEIAINWNAPLAWALFYLDEKGAVAKSVK
jgi:endoglucanase